MSRKCDSCGENEATIHLTDITSEDGKEARVEKHLCEKCAERNQVAASQKTLNMAAVLQQLLQQKLAQEMPGGAEASCPACGMSYLEFRSSLRLGCPHDYEVLEPGLMPILERIQDGPRHCGKAPSRADQDVHRQNELIRLRRELGARRRRGRLRAGGGPAGPDQAQRKPRRAADETDADLGGRMARRHGPECATS